MPNTIQRIRILLSSPSNLELDRATVREVAGQINDDSGRRDGFHVEVVTWESHTRPAAGSEPQSIINEQFPDDIDIYVGLLGAYFGTPTKSWRSGTEEEFRLAYESWSNTAAPEIMFYFGDVDTRSLSELDPDQLKLCQEFRKEIGALGVKYEKYNDTIDFKVTLHRQISDAVYDVLKKHASDGAAFKPPAQTQEHLPNYERLVADRPDIAIDDLLDFCSDTLNEHTSEMERLTQDVVRLSKDLTKFTKRILNDRRLENANNMTASAASIVQALNNYQKKVRIRLPLMRDAMETTLVSAQRAINIVKAADLNADFPVSQLQYPLEGMRDSLSDIVPALLEINKATNDWPEEGDIGRHKNRVIALHQDIVVYVESSVGLINKTIRVSL